MQDENALLAEFNSQVRNTVKEELSKIQSSFKKGKWKGEDTYLTRKELAEKLRCSYSSIHRRVNDGTLTCHKFGRKSLFRLADVEAILIKSNSERGVYGF